LVSPGDNIDRATGVECRVDGPCGKFLRVNSFTLFVAWPFVAQFWFAGAAASAAALGPGSRIGREALRLTVNGA
jgi:hypothetical protein